MSIRLRIAPSPTGYLHVGTARTALYNYLFAKQKNGAFILRIEDTDTQRSSDEMTNIIIEGLKWMGLNHDEGPFFQSDFFEHYKSFIPEMEQSGGIYKCFCTQEELAERRDKAIADKVAWKYDRKCLHLTSEEIDANIKKGKPYTIRVRIPEGKTFYDDLVHGIIEKDNSEIEDFIIFRSDMTPIYNLAVVIDDIRMGITHVVRGDDHISNTFKQIHIYNILKKTPPRFAHLPLILDEKKAKLSKRSGPVSVLAFRDMGILPEAFVNFISLIGWNPGGDREFMTMREMIELFSFEKVTKKGGVFDYKKLEWMNSKYITNKTNEELLELSRPFFEKEYVNLDFFDKETLLKIIGSVKEKARYMVDFPKLTTFFFNEVEKYDEKGAAKFLTAERIGYIKELSEKIKHISDYNEHSIEAVYKEFADERQLKGSDIIHPTRLALSGVTEGPSLFLMMEILGKDKVIDRLTKAEKFVIL